MASEARSSSDSERTVASKARWSSDFERTVASKACSSSDFERTVASKVRSSSDFERTVASKASSSRDFERPVAAKHVRAALSSEPNRFLEFYRLRALARRSAEFLETSETPETPEAIRTLNRYIYIYIKLTTSQIFDPFCLPKVGDA